MRLRFLGAALAAVLAAAMSSTALAAGGGFRIVEAQARLPDRAFVLSLPSRMQLGPQQVQIRENGRLITGASISAAGAAPVRQFGVVLLIDASESMRGNAIGGAMSAAQTFAAQRSPQEQLAVITFNRTPSVLLPFTTDQASIDATLAERPDLVYGTRIYDAIDSALELLANAHIKAGSIVVLSDGADTGSRISESTVTSEARAAHVRIFGVGLRSRFFEPGPLTSLARDTGAEYSLAGSLSQLKQIYQALGSKLAREYLIRYRSTARPGDHISVAVQVRGLPGLAVSGYTVPRKGFKGSGPSPYGESFLHRLWISPVTMIFIALLTAALVALAIVAVAGSRKRGSLRRRMGQFVSLPMRPDEERPSAVVADRVEEGAERLLSGTRWWDRFGRELELAGIKSSPERIVLFTFIGTFLTIWLLSLFTGWVIAALFGLIVPVLVRTLIKRKVERKRTLFADQLPDNLQVLASALRAGHSFIGALSVVVDDAPEPSHSEFRRVIADEQLGVPLEDALHVVVERMASPELEQVGLVAALHRQSGGNTAEVLDRVTETIRERFELRRTVRTLTAQGRMSRWIVSLLPVFLLLVLTIINPSYMNVLWAHTGGRIALTIAALMVITGSLVIRRIVNIRV